MKTKLAVLALLLAIGGSLFAQEGTPVKSIVGSGVPGGSVAHIVGTQYIDQSVSPNVVYVCSSVSVESVGPNPPIGTQTCTWTQIGGSGTTTSVTTLPGGVGNAINPMASPYNAVPGRFISDATTVAGSSTITCPNSDCNFVAGNVGNTVYVGNLTSDTNIISGPSAIICPETTIATVNNAQSITVTAATDCTANTTATAVLVWGPLSHTQLNAAWAAANASCLPMLLPPGTWLIESAVFNTSSIANCSTGGVTGGYGSGSIVGFGQTVSLLAPTPNFSAASCTGGASGTGCMLSGASGNLANLGVYGAGQSAIGAGFNGKIGIDFSGANNSNNYIYNLGLFSWGATTTGFTGIKFEAMSGSSATNMINDGFGRTGCVVAMPGITNMVTFENSYCAVNGLASLVISSGNFTSHQGVYGFTATTSNVSTVQCLSTAICNFDGDFVPYQTGIGSPQMIVEQTATMYLHNVYVLNGSGTNFCVATFGGGTLYVRDSTISCTTASAAILTQTTGKTFLEGGNTVNGPIKNTGTGITYFNTQDTYTTALDASVFPTCTFTSGGGTSPSCALQAGSTNEKGIIIATTGTGAPGTTGTVTLTFAGTYTGATGAAPACTVSPDDSGTAWGNGALAKVSTQSTTAPVFAWSNSAANVLTALAVSSPFRMDYTCTAR